MDSSSESGSSDNELPPFLLSKRLTKVFQRRSPIEKLFNEDARELHTGVIPTKKDVLLLAEKIKRDNFGKSGGRAMSQSDKVNILTEKLKDNF